MTRKEAIVCLKGMKNYGRDTFTEQSDWQTSLDMAIEALEHEECEDAVSRQAVINTLYEMDKVLNVDRTVERYRDLLKECYTVLPPVNPQKTGHWIKTPKAVMGEGYMWYCDKCGHEVYQDSSRHYPSEKFCPNCGAKMIEPQESEVSK